MATQRSCAGSEASSSATIGPVSRTSAIAYVRPRRRAGACSSSAIAAVADPSPRTIPNRGVAARRSRRASCSTASRRSWESGTPRRRASPSSTARSSVSAATVVLRMAMHQMLASAAELVTVMARHRPGRLAPLQRPGDGRRVAGRQRPHVAGDRRRVLHRRWPAAAVRADAELPESRTSTACDARGRLAPWVRAGFPLGLE